MKGMWFKNQSLTDTFGCNRILEHFCQSNYTQNPMEAVYYAY